MKINELIAEQKQLDELSLSGVGQGIGKVVRGVSKGVGAVAGGIAGIPDAVKQGFRAGKDVVGGQTQPTTNQTTSAPTAGSSPIDFKAALANKGAEEPVDNTAAPTSQAPVSNPTPADIRAQKQTSAAKVAQDQMAANPAPTQQSATPTQQPAAPVDNTTDKGFGFDGNTGKPFASQEERTAWFKANNKVDPKAATQSPEEIRKAKQADAAKVAQDQMAANSATTPPVDSAPADATAPTKAGKVGVPAGKAAVDQAVDVVKSVRSDRRQNVVQYAKEKIDALQKAPADTAASVPAEENPNIVKGYNENIDRILYLTKIISSK
jgi:hypothetical protein